MSVGDNKSEYTKFIQESDQDVKDNMLSIYSIITGINLTSMDNIYYTLDKFMGEAVDSSSLPSAVGIVRNYLFEKDPNLRDVASLINSLPNENIETFIKMLNDLSNGNFYDISEIEDIEKYDNSITI